VSARLSVAPLVIAALFAAAGTTREPLAAPDIVVTRDSLLLPAGCTARTLATFVARFFDAFNRADWENVDAFLAPAGASAPDGFRLFAWEREVVDERSRVVPFLADLWSRGERFRLTALLADKESRIATSVAVNYVVERQGRFSSGKGLIDCVSQKIWQWAMSSPRGNLTLLCPRPAGWSPSGPIVACTAGPNARALAPDFRITSAPAVSRLPRRCRPAAVKRRLGASLAAFNIGRGDAFARNFVPRGRFHPYTGSIKGAGFAGRGRIAGFVRARYRKGDGWTAARLLPPQGAAGLPDRAVYQLKFRVSYQGHGCGAGGSQARCRLSLWAARGLGRSLNQDASDLAVDTPAAAGFARRGPNALGESPESHHGRAQRGRTSRRSMARAGIEPATPRFSAVCSTD